MNNNQQFKVAFFSILAVVVVAIAAVIIFTRSSDDAAINSQNTPENTSQSINTIDDAGEEAQDLQPDDSSADGVERDSQTDKVSDTPAVESARDASVAPSTLELESDEYIIPTTNNHFSIQQVAPAAYSVELYAIINNPSQYEQYVADLAAYKQEALEYMTNAGVDTSQVDITYTPSEAEEL